MQISIAMATYNGERYLKAQLESIVSQTLRPVELVVSDDGSTDGTRDLIRAFAADAPFTVRLLDKKHKLGFADNFLFAAEACTSELIAFCDQDDIWLPTKLEVGLNRLEIDKSLLSMHRLITTNKDLQPTGLWSQDIESDSVFKALELDPYITGWGNTMLFRRELLLLIKRGDRPRQPEGKDRLLSHDTWLYVLAAALGRVSHIQEPLILYRQHGANTEGITHRPPRFWHRLAAWTTVPLIKISEQGQFYQAMTDLFSDLAMSGHHLTFKEPAANAATIFAKRRDFQATHLKLYTSRQIGDRWRAYRSLQVMPRDKSPWLGSKLKELVLGVAAVKRVSQY